MRKILALTLVGAVSLFSTVTAMAQQTSEPPTQAPSSQNSSSQNSSNEPPSSQAPANQIDSVQTQSNERSLTEFWTPERLNEARPMPTPRVDSDEGKK
jgi:cytoskeletal protein RodZ